MKKLSFFLMAMLISVMSFAAESLQVTLDFSKNTTWGFPNGSSAKTTATKTYTNGDYSITLAGGGSGNGHYWNNQGYLMLGKSGATLTLPAFDFNTTKIVVVGRSGASASTLQNIYVGSTAVSTQTKGSAVTNTYAIAEDYQAAGNVYIFKVGSSHNSQIVKIEIYGEEGGEQGEKVDAPKFSVTETNFKEAFDLTISSAEGTTLKYTTDNTDPKTSATAVSVETNTANVAIPAKSTVVKAVAVKGDLVSVVASTIYAYVNSPETAYTVAEAMEVIDAGLGLENELYVKGEISLIEKFDATYGSITYWIKDEEGNKFECYSGLGLNKAKFTKKEDLVVGSKVVVCGTMKKYNTTYEFNYNNYIVSLELPVVNHTITVSANPAEGGFVTGGGEFEETDEITVKAVANENYVFVNWTENDVEVSTEAEYTFEVLADRALVANFQVIPCTQATPVNWDAPIAAEANTDQWYAVNIASAIAAKKDIALTVANSGAAAVEVTVEAYANCPATEKIAGATSTINAGATKTTTVKYDEYLADQVEVVYLHVVTSGDLTVDAEVIEPCTQATAINWDAPIAAAANIDAWYAVNVESAIAAGKDLALTVSNPSTEAVEVSIEAYANCPATEKIAGATSTIEAGATKTTTVKYDEYLADQVKVVYMHVTTKGGEIKVEAETVKFNVAATAENGTVEGAGIYEQGAEATLKAIPAEGYEFVNWTVDGAEVSTENPYTFVVTANVALVANFKKAAPATETVYFINNKGWSKVNAYAWEPVQNANWPGVAATKEAEQIGGYDVYSYTADAGKYANVIFNNGSGQQTADLKWTAGKYVINNQWYTKEEAEAQLVKPVEYEYVYFVNVQAWNKVNIYTWTPEVGTWPGVAMTKEAEQLAGYDVYSYKAEKGTSFGGVIFNNGSGEQTGDLKWTAGKYYVKDGWYTKEEAEAKLAGPVTPPVITYVLMGVAGDWTTGIALTQNADNANEYVLLGQDIAEGDAVKVVTLTDGTATAWCGNVDEYSVAHSADDMGNIVLAPGKYDFYYKVAEDLIYIGATAPVEPDYEIMPIEMTNLEVQDMGEFVLLQASDLSMTGISVTLGVYADGHLHEGSAVDWNGTELPIVEGNITKTVDAEKGDVYAGLVVVEFGEGKMGLDLTMYSAAVEAIEVFASDAEVVINESTGTLEFTTTWEGYPVLVTVAGYEDVEFKEYEGAQISELTIGDDDNWYDFAVANVVAVIKDGNTFSIEGEYTSWATGATYYVMIDGEIPVVKPEKPEPTYTENKLNTYAFGLESELSDDQATLTVTYRLNNSNATAVNVVVYNGTEVVATIPGTTTIGVNTVEVATAELPTGVELTWAVEVNGTSVDAPTREEKIYSFYHPSGVDIDINPENETFGLLLVNEGMQSVASKTEGYVSAGFGAGIFAFTPSFDLVANGELPGYNGGIEFTNTRADGTGTAYAPRRIRISEDGRIFVTSLNTDGNYLWEVNPNNLNEWTTVFKGTLNDQRELVDAEGNFVAAPNNGFDVKGSGENLQLAMYSVNLSGITAAAMSGFRLHEYNLGTATEWATAPSKALVEGKYAINYTGTQVEYDNEGGFWIASYRGSATDANPGLVHINAEGVEDCKLVWNNVRQAGIRFNKDFTKLVVAGNNGAAKKATIYTISKDANGAPVLTQEAVVDMAVVGNNLNDFAWDYAGNLYACGNSSEKLAAWAMPYSGQVVTPAASVYAFQLEDTGSDYEMYEDVITNLVIDYDNMLLIGGPSEAFQVEVVLGLGDYDRNTDAFQLLPASTISVRGSEAQFIDGVASVDGIAQTATAIVHCTWNGMALEFHLTMSATPMEATIVVVENAAIEIEKFIIFGDTYDYSLKMTGVWTNEGIDYPVLVEVPVYYPEATEPYEIYSTVTVGGWGDEDPWLGFGEGYLTITPEGEKITATGVVENPMAGVAIDITISGNINNPGLALDNATVVIKSIKKIQNGQLIIEKDGVQYNAQGAILK